MQTKCKECGKPFQAKREWQKFCSDRCRWECWEKNNPRMSVVVSGAAKKRC